MRVKEKHSVAMASIPYPQVVVHHLGILLLHNYPLGTKHVPQYPDQHSIQAKIKQIKIL